MTNDPPSDNAVPKPNAKTPRRAEALAAALRENLRRRKAQAQARTGAPPAPEQDEPQG